MTFLIFIAIDQKRNPVLIQEHQMSPCGLLASANLDQFALNILKLGTSFEHCPNNVVHSISFSPTMAKANSYSVKMPAAFSCTRTLLPAAMTMSAGAESRSR